MATELAVTHGFDIKLTELVTSSETAILDMLNLKVTTIVLDRFSNEKTPLTSEVYSLPGAVWRFGISGRPCLAFGTVLEVSGGLESTFEVGGGNENLGYILTAALAVGCARISGAPILDDNCGFMSSAKTSAASFVSHFRLKSSDDADDQSIRFVSKVMMNQPNGPG